MPPADAWVDRRLVVQDSSIEGRGLVFTADLPARAEVMRLGGRYVSSEELAFLVAQADADPASPYVDTISVYDNAHLVLPPNTAVHFSNHSCDPTLWLVGPLVVATRRAVVAGEEATIDYGTVSGAEGFVLVCRCGASNCRSEITSNDWTREDLRARYDGHWAPVLQQRIDDGR